tara:strand:+ start:851 stop:1084 length:234 start_codon:yes stop_codon:yes gene_type:complete
MEQPNLNDFNPDKVLDEISVRHACTQLEELMQDASFWKMADMKVKFAAHVNTNAVENGFSEDQAFDLAVAMTDAMFT